MDGERVIFSVMLLPSVTGTYIEVRMPKSLSHAAFDDTVKPCLDKLARNAPG